MGVTKRYTIAYKGLKPGLHDFRFEVDGSLFEEFESPEIKDGACEVTVALESEEEKRSRLTSFLKDTCVADVAGYCKQPATESLDHPRKSRQENPNESVRSFFDCVVLSAKSLVF